MWRGVGDDVEPEALVERNVALIVRFQPHRRPVVVRSGQDVVKQHPGYASPLVVRIDGQARKVPCPSLPDRCHRHASPGRIVPHAGQLCEQQSRGSRRRHQGRRRNTNERSELGMLRRSGTERPAAGHRRQRQHDDTPKALSVDGHEDVTLTHGGLQLGAIDGVEEATTVASGAEQDTVQRVIIKGAHEQPRRFIEVLRTEFSNGWSRDDHQRPVPSQRLTTRSRPHHRSSLAESLHHPKIHTRFQGT